MRGTAVLRRHWRGSRDNFLSFGYILAFLYSLRRNCRKAEKKPKRFKKPDTHAHATAFLMT